VKHVKKKRFKGGEDTAWLYLATLKVGPYVDARTFEVLISIGKVKHPVSSILAIVIKAALCEYFLH
jgi:hypothetical protein